MFSFLRFYLGLFPTVLLLVLTLIARVKAETLKFSHNTTFITQHPTDEELNQEQMRRIVKPIQKMLLAQLLSQQQLEEELKKVLSILQVQGFSQGYAYQNISHLITAGK